MKSIRDGFLQRTPGSALRARRAATLMPGGDTRAAAHHDPYQLSLSHGEGPHLFDVDGNRYIDLLGNFTSLVHGNAYPPIQQAAADAASSGTVWPALNDHLLELADELTSRVSSVDLVRFTNSGSEATSLAVTIARAATKRPKFLMARHGYHGSMPEFSTEAALAENSRTLTATFGDITSFEAVLDQAGSEIACVIIEPVMGAGGVVSPPAGFLEQLTAAAHRVGAIVVLDEIMTLRLAQGGCQQTEGLTPDLTTMGKIIGGGYPVGAIGGRADLMELCDPTKGRIFHSGTFNGNPVTAAAGLVSLQHLTSTAIANLAQRTERLERELAEAAALVGLPFSSRRAGSLLQVYLADAIPSANPGRSDVEPMTLLHLAALNHGVFIATRGLIALSTAIDDATLDEAIGALTQALHDVKATESS